MNTKTSICSQFFRCSFDRQRILTVAKPLSPGVVRKGFSWKRVGDDDEKWCRGIDVFGADLWISAIIRVGNNHEGSIPFTRSTDFRALAVKKCSKQIRFHSDEKRAFTRLNSALRHALFSRSICSDHACRVGKLNAPFPELY